jgi:hypothetical protein
VLSGRIQFTVCHRHVRVGFCDDAGSGQLAKRLRIVHQVIAFPKVGEGRSVDTNGKFRPHLGRTLLILNVVFTAQIIGDGADSFRALFLFFGTPIRLTCHRTLLLRGIQHRCPAWRHNQPHLAQKISVLLYH